MNLRDIFGVGIAPDIQGPMIDQTRLTLGIIDIPGVSNLRHPATGECDGFRSLPILKP